MHRWLVTRMLPNRGLARPARLNGRKSISAPCAKEGLTCICVLLLPDAIFVFQTRESASGAEEWTGGRTRGGGAEIFNRVC